MARASDQEERDQRRAEVAEMMTRRMSQTWMAERLGVSRATIQRDVQAIQRTWLREINNKEKQLRASEARSLDHLETVAQLNMENALRLRQAEEAKSKKDGGGIHSVAWERYDRSMRAWFEKRIQIQERRAKLLNLDAQPKQQAPSVQMPITFIAMAPPEDRTPLNVTPPDPPALDAPVVRYDDDG